MKPPKVLSVEEITKASDIFFPLFNTVSERMPDGSSVEDTLKVMENICQVAIKLRAEAENPAGFNKISFDQNPESESEE